MANNYFGFTPGAAQYAAQPAYATPAAQTAYVQQAAPAAAYATATRPATAYDAAYQTAQTGQYAYARTAQVAAVVQPAAVAAAYDQTKTYAYAPAAPSYTVSAESYAAAPQYTTPAVSTYGQPTYSKPAYTQSASYAAPARQQTQKIVNTPSAATYVYPATTAAAASTYGASYAVQTTSATPASYSAGYDAALYSAATSYYQQQHGPVKTNTNQQTFQKKIFTKKPIKPAPKAPQLHYCDVCKISCAGPQTYREHLEGQKHKKKEVAAKAAATVSSARGGQNQLKCELCDVACTGTDAYAAHIRGAKHQKVMKLHARLGKPIPTTEPTVITPSGSTVKAAAKTVTKTVTTATAGVTKKVLATPKITFVGGSQLKTTQKKTAGATAAAAAQVAIQEIKVEPTVTEEDEKDDIQALLNEADVTPVGHEYVEEVRTDGGKVISFNCKLCECKFNDPNAKEMHLKGRRHRLQYKKKVDPTLLVEVKPSIRARKVQEDKARRQAAKEEYWRRRDEDAARMSTNAPFWPRFDNPAMPFMRRHDTSDDRHAMAKHNSIYPNEQELEAVQKMVSNCEKALKAVSDFIAESDAPKESPKPTEVKKEDTAAENDDDAGGPRALKGVMRVGVLAKGLLLHSQLDVNLVVLCTEKPTRTLLERMADSLPKQLEKIETDEKYEVKRCVEEAAIIVTSTTEPVTSCTVTLTSPTMRGDQTPVEGETPAKDPPDVLDRQKCLDALAALRHAKWFQARANGLPSCVVIIRIMRDLCSRVPTWAPLSEWAMELLVEKCLSSGGPSGPGDALRRIFECIASGIFLPGGPGLYDPCEKEPTDAATALNNQEREDITGSAQHALRLIAFRQIHKVLGMDQLPAPKFQRRPFNPRKRRRTNSTGENGDAEAGEGKKDKKEGEETETAK